MGADQAAVVDQVLVAKVAGADLGTLPGRPVGEEQHRAFDRELRRRARVPQGAEVPELRVGTPAESTELFDASCFPFSLRALHPPCSSTMGRGSNHRAIEPG